MKRDKIEIVKSFYLGQKNCINIIIYGKNIDKDPSFTFKIKFPDGQSISWDSCLENCGGFEFETQEDAIDAALDFLVDHTSFKEIDEPINLENPEDNIEEVPEDFRLDMKN